MGYWLGIVFSCLDVLCVAVFCDAFLERKTRGLRFVVGPGFFLTHTTILFPESCHRYAQLLPIFCHRTSCDRESLLLQ